MEYVGEHLLPGKIGHFFVVLSLISSAVAAFSFFKSANALALDEAAGWKKLARLAFSVDVISVFSVFLTIYYIIHSHLFEYNYAWEHSSKSLDFKYLLSCIWEAQEGSFLLWTMWHCILGLVLMATAGKWEAPVMAVISTAQFCLATMILGIYIGDQHIGHSPFSLVRNLFADAPIFNRPDYLSIPQMQDGQGLNALLQNYWMVIHPPILFLGFSSTIVPFAFAIAGLWKKDYGGWTKKALPWTLFSACFLGTGIMMGAAWAYESLSFGGYWAWDPVENASLVPWLVLVAGLHTQLIFNSTGHSLRSTYFFFIMEFVLILYSTFLTRSGILGDTSVHAFVESGMNFQLVSFVVVFFLPAIILFAVRYATIPHIAKEENTYSREFWMFIGSLVIFLSSLFIIIATSLPVINKLFGTKWTVGEDAAFAYNRIEVFVAVILGLLTAAVQYLKYKNTPKNIFFKKMAIPFGISLVISTLISILGNVHYDKYGNGFLLAVHLAIFSAVFAIVANTGYIWEGLKGNIKAAGASVAHLGFGMMLLGILISSAKKEVLSYNTTGINIDFGPEAKQNPLENLTLLKNVQTDMGKYWATYVSNDSLNKFGTARYYHIAMEKKDGSEKFDLYPFLIKATKGQQGFAFNPSKHHYWDRDIFAYITALDNTSEADSGSFKNYSVALHDTAFYSNGYIVLEKVVPNPDNDKYHFTANDTALMVELTVVGKDSIRHKARPLFYVKNNEMLHRLDTVFSENLVIGLNRVVDTKRLELSVKETPKVTPFVALKVYEFPQINLLWIGTLVMIAGFMISVVRRVRTQSKLRVT